MEVQMMHSVDAMRMFFDYMDATEKKPAQVNVKAAAKWGFDKGYYDVGQPGDPENEQDKIALVAGDLREIQIVLS